MLDKLNHDPFAKMTVIEDIHFINEVYINWSEYVVEEYYDDLKQKYKVFTDWLEDQGISIIVTDNEHFLGADKEEDMVVFLLKQPWTEKK